MARLFGLVCGVAVLVACSGQTDEQSSPPHDPDSSTKQPPTGGGSSPFTPFVSLEPNDLTSNAKPPIRAVLSAGHAPNTPQILSELATSLELRSLPDLQLIPADATIITAPATENQFVELQLKAAPIADGWYVISLKSLPAGVLGSARSAPQPPIGVYASRFFVGQRPTLSQVTLCVEAPKLKAVFEFSEAVVIPSDVETFMRVEQGDRSCVYDRPAGIPPAVQWFDLLCPGFTPGGLWRIRLNPGLKSRSGMDVTTFTGPGALDELVDTSKLPDLPGGCKGWRP